MRIFLTIYDSYKLLLIKIKQQLKSGKILPQEAQERATAGIVNLNSIISSIEYVYPNELVDKISELVDEYESFKTSIESNNQFEQEEKNL